VPAIEHSGPIEALFLVAATIGADDCASIARQCGENQRSSNVILRVGRLTPRLEHRRLGAAKRGCYHLLSVVCTKKSRWGALGYGSDRDLRIHTEPYQRRVAAAAAEPTHGAV